VLKQRLIPVVLLRNGVVVQSKGFKRYQVLGNPYTIVQRLSDWASDELIYLDISREKQYDLGRDDLKTWNRDSLEAIIAEVAKSAFMPLTVGGGIRTLEAVQKRLYLGADKVAINTQALKDPAFITRCAESFGSQCVVVSMDVKKDRDNWEIYMNGGKEATHKTAVDWAKEAESRGAGELLVNSIDNDGRGQGYDLDLIHSVSSAVAVPVIACGGVGKWEHFISGIEAGASAVAAANIFHYTENSVYNAKKSLFEQGCNVRPPRFGAGNGEDERIMVI
jgi:cyclase